MLSNEKILNNNTDNNINDNKKYTDITNNGKLYDINEDFLSNNADNGLSLNALKKFKTFKEYKESLENPSAATLKSVSKKKDVLLDKIGNKKITDLSTKNLNSKIEKWDKKSSLNRKNILQDLQNTREQFLREKHKTYHNKLHIPTFGYPNITKISRSSTLPKATPKNHTSSDNQGSSYVETLKKEALSLAERMKKIDENASEDIIRRFEKITNDSLERSKTSPNSDNFNKLIMKELKNNRPTKRENSKYDLLLTEKVSNKSNSSKIKRNIKSSENKIENKNKDKTVNEKSKENDNIKDKGDKIKEIAKNDKEKDESISDREDLIILDNKTKTIKKYNEEDMNTLIDDLTLNISSPISYSKNIIEKSKQIKEKRRKEKKKGIRIILIQIIC